jgi:hypothetical protein
LPSENFATEHDSIQRINPLWSSCPPFWLIELLYVIELHLRPFFHPAPSEELDRVESNEIWFGGVSRDAFSKMLFRQFPAYAAGALFVSFLGFIRGGFR